MVDTFRDLNSVIDELKGLSKRILEPASGSLTSVQMQTSRDQIKMDIKEKVGIEFGIYFSKTNPHARTTTLTFVSHGRSPYL